MSGSKAKVDPEKIKKLKVAFEASWKKEELKIAGMTSDAWHKSKALAGVKSAPWFKKSNNIGPKLDKLETTSAKFTKQVNTPNLLSLSGALSDLVKALTAFETNRKGSDASKDGDIQDIVKDYKARADGVHTWIAQQQKTVELLNSNEFDDILGEVVPH